MVLSGATYRWGLISLFRAVHSGRISPESGLSTGFSTNTGADSESLRRNEDGITSAFLYPTLSPTSSNQRIYPTNAPSIPSEPIYIVLDSTGLKVYGEGEWKVKKHGADKRRTWRKLHLAVDEATNELHAVELTTNAISDADMVKPLVAGIIYPIARLSGDGAYDQVKVYDELETRRIEPVIPPRSNAVIWTDEAGNDLVHARNEALMKIDCVGLAEWKRQIGYHRRSKAQMF